MAKRIPLSFGHFATVDDEDFERLSRHRWYFDGGYALRTISGTSRRFMHHDIAGRRAGLQVDHANGDGLDNRRANLRHATHRQNTLNRRPVIRRDASRGSRFKGVSRDPSENRTTPWRARITVAPGRQVLLGRFQTEEGAARAYDRAAIEHHGQFARLNFPDDAKRAVA